MSQTFLTTLISTFNENSQGGGRGESLKRYRLVLLTFNWVSFRFVLHNSLNRITLKQTKLKRRNQPPRGGVISGRSPALFAKYLLYYTGEGWVRRCVK